MLLHFLYLPIIIIPGTLKGRRGTRYRFIIKEFIIYYSNNSTQYKHLQSQPLGNQHQDPSEEMLQLEYLCLLKIPMLKPNP